MIPGTPGLEHRIGGLEKEYLTGNVSYAPDNHEQMVRVRARKIAGIVREIPPTEVHGRRDGDLLVIGWGSTYGAIAAATRTLREQGKSVSHVHLRYLNPLPADLGDILAALQAGAGAGDEHGPARPAAARRVPGRRRRPQQDPGPAVQGRARSSQRDPAHAGGVAPMTHRSRHPAS